MIQAGRYNFEELYWQAKKPTATKEERLELFKWFNLYGDVYWNGECYDLGGWGGRPTGSESLYPIYEEVLGEDGEPIEFIVVDCEIR